MDTKPENEDKPKKGNYQEKLKVKGSFLDIMKASMKDADSKTKKKGS
ncbi:MAG: hypothetical protein JWQ09_949 [Segetibacter sp.]|nr:hypothetical protein [Segetibacter sp.]